MNVPGFPRLGRYLVVERICVKCRHVFVDVVPEYVVAAREMAGAALSRARCNFCRGRARDTGRVHRF